MRRAIGSSKVISERTDSTRSSNEGFLVQDLKTKLFHRLESTPTFGGFRFVNRTRDTKPRLLRRGFAFFGLRKYTDFRVATESTKNTKKIEIAKREIHGYSALCSMQVVTDLRTSPALCSLCSLCSLWLIPFCSSHSNAVYARGSVMATKRSPASAPPKCASWLIRPCGFLDAYQLYAR